MGVYLRVLHFHWVSPHLTLGLPLPLQEPLAPQDWLQLLFFTLNLHHGWEFFVLPWKFRKKENTKTFSSALALEKVVKYWCVPLKIPLSVQSLSGHFLKLQLPFLSPLHHSCPERQVCSGFPHWFLSPPSKTATWLQSKTSVPDILNAKEINDVVFNLSNIFSSTKMAFKENEHIDSSVTLGIFQ